MEKSIEWKLHSILLTSNLSSLFQTKKRLLTFFCLKFTGKEGV